MKHFGTRVIKTDRLCLRPFEINDSRDMLENWISNPNVQNEYGEPVYIDEKEVQVLLEGWINQYKNLDFYRWAIILNNTNTNIGQIAFCRVYSDVKIAEIEYCISEKYWGNGYAGEALSAVIMDTFYNTHFEKLEAYHRKENNKSGKILEKSLMHKINTVRRFTLLNEDPNGEVCYSITRQDCRRTDMLCSL